MYQIDARFIRNELFKRSLAAKEMARLVGVNEFTMKKLLKDGATASAKIVGKLAAFFGVEGEQLILKP